MTKEEFLNLFKECIEDGSIHIVVDVDNNYAGNYVENSLSILGSIICTEKGYFNITI